MEDDISLRTLLAENIVGSEITADRNCALGFDLLITGFGPSEGVDLVSFGYGLFDDNRAIVATGASHEDTCHIDFK